MPFTPEELAEMAAADAEIEADFDGLSYYEIKASEKLDRESDLDNLPLEKRRKIDKYRKYRAVHKEEIKKRRKKHYQDHREEDLAKTKEYYFSNREAIAKRKADWYQKNKERILEKQRVYRKSLQERERESS